MNKAFLREAEEPDPRCPACGTQGVQVAAATVEAHLRPAVRNPLVGTAYYCPNARCEVGYYDAVGQQVAITHMHGLAYPKDPAGPVCSCFGVTAEQIEQEARAGRTALVKEWLAKAASPAAECARRAPDGRGCAAAVQKLYLAQRGKVTRG